MLNRRAGYSLWDSSGMRVDERRLLETGAELMQICSTVFGYFGPEVQLPLTSLIGALSGIILIVGKAPIRVVKRWLEEIKQETTS
jgi:hypothetical protein